PDPRDASPRSAQGRAGSSPPTRCASGGRARARARGISRLSYAASAWRRVAFWAFCAPTGGADAATRLTSTTQRIRDMAVILEESSFGFQCVPASDGVVGIHLHALGLRLVARPLHADGVSAGLHTKADDRR